MSDQRSTTWVATGRRLNMGNEPRLEIPITELSRSVSMGDGDLPYGLPVDAPLGVQLIRNLSEQLRKEAPDEKSWVRRLFEQTPAVTLDKNILLKILSQPKSEGIRFYPCLKKNSDGTDLLSLVAVAVDAEGKDLLYDYNPDIHRSGIQNIPTTSLVAEYGHPPGVAEENDTAGLDPFVLFRYSENI
jgi:hypothetical protein